MVDPLVRLELGEKLRRDAKVLPANLPIRQLLRIARLKLVQLTEQLLVKLRHESGVQQVGGACWAWLAMACRASLVTTVVSR